MFSWWDISPLLQPKQEPCEVGAPTQQVVQNGSHCKWPITIFTNLIAAANPSKNKYPNAKRPSTTAPEFQPLNRMQQHLPAPHTTRTGGAYQDGHPGRVKTRGGRKSEEIRGAGINLITLKLYFSQGPPPANTHPSINSHFRPKNRQKNRKAPANYITRVGGANRDGRTSVSLQAAAVGDALDGWRGMVMVLIYN